MSREQSAKGLDDCRLHQDSGVPGTTDHGLRTTDYGGHRPPLQKTGVENAECRNTEPSGRVPRDRRLSREDSDEEERAATEFQKVKHGAYLLETITFAV
jgi:hypothetical protein